MLVNGTSECVNIHSEPYDCTLKSSKTMTKALIHVIKFFFLSDKSVNAIVIQEYSSTDTILHHEFPQTKELYEGSN